MSTADQELEELLARVLEDFETRGPAALEEACLERPDLATRLRERVGTLARLGFVEAAGGDNPGPIGPWRPIARLGRGGMSIVWLVERADGTRAALKVLATPPGFAERSQARFLREIRAFEGVVHPGVVRLLDAGEHEGRPWYAMEYAPGVTLAAVIDALRARGIAPESVEPAAVERLVRELLPIPPREPDGAPRDSDIVSRDSEVVPRDSEVVPRDSEVVPRESDVRPRGEWGRTWIECAARIALDVAEGLAHLHARGIVHRDVKPGNVLLRLDSRAQIFDLGLAHVDDEPSLTDTGDFAGTPFYVSPEQARGKRGTVDGRTDVYALGATLYELLTLRRPFDGGGTADVLVRIQTEEPVAPRRIAPHVPRELETICLTSLEKDPRRRYAGARELADDLRRFLAWQPVRARPLGPLARAEKFSRRRPGAATAIVLAALIAIGVPIGLAIANARIRGERDRAEASALEAARQANLRERAAEFLVDLFHAAGGEGTSARDLLATGARAVQSSFEDQPLARAQLLEALGRGYMNLGAPEQALPLFDRAFALRQRELGEDHLPTRRALLDLGTVQVRLERPIVARALFERSLSALERATGRDTIDWARGAIALAETEEAAGGTDRARTLYAGALGSLAAIQRDDGPDAARALERLGNLELLRDDLVAARARLEAALALHARAWRPDLGSRARVLDALSACAARAGDTIQSATFASQAVALRAAPATPSGPWNEDDTRRLIDAFEPPGRAEWRATFQSGITALQTSDTRAAQTAFERCLILRPDDSAAAYNLACARLVAGDVNGAFGALHAAAEHGLAHFPERVEALRRDVDVAAIRADPRWPVLDARIERAERDGRAWAADTVVVVPAGPVPAAGWPLLVLLHGDGSSKEIEAQGPWAAFAREQGAVLVVPAARYVSAEDPRRGGAWLSDAEDLARRPWRYVEPALDDVRRVVAAHPIDRARVVAVGEEAGAAVAFEMACRASGLFSGVVLVDGAVHPGLAAASAPAAAALGLRVEALVEASSGDPRAAERLEQCLRHLGFGAERGVVHTSDADSLATRASSIAGRMLQ